MRHLKQSILDLEYKNDYSLENFIIGDCNELAFSALNNLFKNNIADKFCVIYGDNNCGKTHLLKGFTTSHNLVYRTSLQVYRLSLWEWLQTDEKIVILDDAHLVNNDQWWFHIYNLTKELDKKLIITSSIAPTNLNIELEDWKSRLATFLTIEIQNPDDATIIRVMKKMFCDNGVKVEDSILEFIIKNTERSFNNILHVIKAILNASAVYKKPITYFLVREVLKTQFKASI